MAKLSWPLCIQEDLITDTVEIAVQINGKVKDRILVPSDASSGEIERLAQNLEKVRAYFKETVPKRVIVVPGRLVNIIG
jgi:leucyl-tRNA synthetase